MRSTGIDPMVVMKMLSRATTTEASYCWAQSETFCATGSAAAMITTARSTSGGRPQAEPAIHATTGLIKTLMVVGRSPSVEKTDGNAG